MTNQELINFEKALKTVKGYNNAKLNYAIAKNLNSLKVETDTFRKMEEEIGEIKKEYDIKYLEVLKENAVKDPLNKPKIIGAGVNVTYDLGGEEGVKKVAPLLNALTESYKEVIEKHDLAWKEYSKFLLQENENFKPFKIKLTTLNEVNPKTEDYQLLFEITEE